ncbi:uncharacterized protein LOC144824337 [Lissotriton helveticus]
MGVRGPLFSLPLQRQRAVTWMRVMVRRWDLAAASTRGSGVTPLAPTSSRYRWQALPAAKELQSQRTGRYGRVQSAPPPGVSKSFKCTVVDTGLGKTRGDLLHTSVDSVVLDYDEESPEEGEVRDPERGVPSHVSSSVLQAPVVQSQVQGRREHGPSSRAPRRPDALTSETRAEPSRVVSLLPGSVAGPRSSVVTVWIVGHSFVKWARVQAARSYFGDLLGFNDRMFNVLWKGKGGMLWRELIPCLNNNMVGGVCPDILVIHLGENDLCATKGVVLLRAMKRDLGLIKERWAGCHVFWTELIPRRIWRGAVNPRAVDRARKKVNSEVSRCCRSLGFSRISHRDIKFESVEFFRDDGVHLSRSPSCSLVASLTGPCPAVGKNNPKQPKIAFDQRRQTRQDGVVADGGDPAGQEDVAKTREDDLKTIMLDVKSTVTCMAAQPNQLSTHLDAAKSRVDSHDAHLLHVESRVSDAEDTTTQVLHKLLKMDKILKLIQNKNKDLEVRSHRRNLSITGVPESTNI